MADDDQTEEEETLDASYKPDATTLDGDESDFAKALGFGSDGNEGADTNAPDEDTTPVATDDVTEDEAEESDTVEAAAEPSQDDAPSESLAGEAADDESAATQDASVEAAAADDEDDAVEAAAGTDGPTVDYEEIQPRPASEGMQETLRTRADEVMARSEIDASPMAPSSSGGATTATLADDAEALAELRRDLSDRDRALAAALADLDATHAELATVRAALEKGGGTDEKELEETRVELETVTIERDQLIDQLAAKSGELVQSRRAAEQLEASLRAARGALVPLPEGERALRAEVIGLRARLDDAAQENVRLASEVASVATELAIAAARVEDRQHEIDFHTDRANELEKLAAEKEEQTEAAIAQHREALTLATRLQAENNELRSAQAALEETLQARDLEIAAREEHLRVTREGLSTRDGQLVDVKESLERERHRVEALEADLERAEIEKSVLLDKVARRESRIATLTNTLGQIEEAMGQRLQLKLPARPVLAQAEWSRPTPAPTSPNEPSTASVDPSAEPKPPASEPAAPTPGPELAPTATLEPEPEPEPAEVRPEAFAIEAAADIAPPTEPAPCEAPEPVVEVDFEVEEDDLPVSREPQPPVARQETAHAATDSDVAPVAPVGEEHFDDAVPNSGETLEDEDLPVRAPGLLSRIPALPTILGRWRDDRVADLEEAGAGSVADFLAQRLVAHLGTPAPEAIRLRSLGGALPDAEARLVTALHAQGLENVRMDVLDVDEELAQARRHRIELACLGEVVDVRVGDLDDWNAEAPCHAVLVADALHPQARPDAVLDDLSSALERGALLLFAGRIGAGPVQLSASTLMRLEELWQFLPEPMASAEGLGRPPFRGDDGGTPAAAIDPAAALVDRFDAIALVGFGHLADLVVGPSRGFALSDDDESRRLLESVVAIDESRGITESLPPRHGVGVFAHGSGGRTDCYGLPWPCLAEALR